MMTLGVHFALSTPDEARLLAAAGNDDDVLEIVEELEERGSEPTCDTDKAWDAIHRCLTDGRLEYANGTYPLNAAVLGGRQLVDDAEYTVSYVSADQVREVSDALGEVDREWLRARHESLPADYRGGEDDFEYTWENLLDLREFYADAAAQGRAVIFTVDA